MENIHELAMNKAIEESLSNYSNHYHNGGPFGAVIVKDDEIISTGYNGAPRGTDNCCDKGFCQRKLSDVKKEDYSDCCSVHAEQNAMLSAARRDMLGATLYLVGRENDTEVLDIAPCAICARMIKNAGLIVKMRKNL